MDTRFGTSNVRGLYKSDPSKMVAKVLSGPLKAAATEVSKYK
jgi:hypothetical protein